MRSIANSNKQYHLLIAGISLTLLNVIYILLVNSGTAYSFVYTVCAFLVINRLIDGQSALVQNFFVLQLYVLLALLIYTVHLTVSPEWKGFTPAIRGIGTDDAGFYARVADNLETIPQGVIYHSALEHSFAVFLKILYPFSIYHPLSIIIPNLLGICFIPFFTQKVSNKMTGDTRVGKAAFFLVMCCPFLLSNSLILMRDGWSAFLIIAGIYYLLEKKYIHYLIILSLLSFIRIGSGLLLAVVPLFYFRNLIFSGTALQRLLKVMTLGYIVVLLLILLLPGISDYLIGKGVSGVGRDEFVETFIGENSSGSTVYEIYSSHIYVKLPLGLLFFFFLPFLTFQFYTEGILNMRTIMCSTIMPLLSIVYFKHLFAGVIHFFKNNDKNIKRFFLIYIALLLLISQLSIQTRHKTAVMPLFYIFVAYGFFNSDRLSRRLGITFTICLCLVQMYMLLR